MHLQSLHHTADIQLHAGRYIPTPFGLDCKSALPTSSLAVVHSASMFLPAEISDAVQHTTSANAPWSVITGSPLSVIHHLGLGVWSFLASPAQGLKESTQGGGLNLPRLLDGFVEGCSSLASNVALAVSTATSKTTETARRGLISLGLDKLEATGQSTSVPSLLPSQP